MKTVLAITAAGLLGTAAHAAPTVYATEAAFTAATTGLSFTTESFERLNQGVGNAVDFGGAVGFDCRNCSPGLSSRYATVGAQSLSLNTGVTEPMAFSFASAVNAVSLDLSDFGTLAAGDLRLMISGETVSLLDDYLGRTGNQLFFGFVSETAFSGFTLIGGNNGDIAYADRLRFAARAVTTPPGNPGAVPEPATWAMMIGGFALVGGALRRRASVRTVALA